MARARNLKPSIFKNEILGTADPLYTILFEGLWCLADREGRLEDRPLRIRAEIFPYRDVNVDSLLSWLHEKEFIIRYRIDGADYIQVNKFHIHQNPHQREVVSIIPPPNGAANRYSHLPVTEEQRQRIFARDGYKCVQCGATETLHCDHKQPISRGGTSEDDNLQTLCIDCNLKKRNDVLPRQGQGIAQAVTKHNLSHAKAMPSPADSLNPLTDSLNPITTLAANAAYSDEFERIWSLYPKRTGDNPKKAAYQHFKARLKTDPLHTIEAGVLRYARYCEATDKTGTEFVMQAKRFFGTSKPYLNEWNANKANGSPKPGKMARAAEALRRTNAAAAADSATTNDRGTGTLPHAGPPARLRAERR